MKKIIVSFALVTTLATPALANGINQPSLLGALVSVGNHGSVANVVAKVSSPSTLADVKANVLDNTIKVDVKAGASQPSYGVGAPSSEVAGLNVVIPGVAGECRHWPADRPFLHLAGCHHQCAERRRRQSRQLVICPPCAPGRLPRAPAASFSFLVARTQNRFALLLADAADGTCFTNDCM